MSAEPRSREALEFTGAGWELLCQGLLCFVLSLLVLPAGYGWGVLGRWFLTSFRLADGRAVEYRPQRGLLGLAIALCLFTAAMPQTDAGFHPRGRLTVDNPALSHWCTEVASGVAGFLSASLHLPGQRIVEAVHLGDSVARPIEFFPVIFLRGLAPVSLYLLAFGPWGTVGLFAVLYVVVCAMWLEVARTLAGGVYIPGLGACRLRGRFLSYLGWNVLKNLSYVTLIGWAWVEVELIRWLVRNIEVPGGAVSLAFRGSGLENLWRSLLVVLVSVATVGLALPWMLVWYYRWVASQTVLERAWEVPPAV